MSQKNCLPTTRFGASASSIRRRSVQNTLLGDAVYGTALFGGFALAQRGWPVLLEAPAVPTLGNATA